MVENIEYAMSMVDCLSNTKRKRHIFGGVLLSMSLFFYGLTLTILTIKNEYYEETEKKK